MNDFNRKVEDASARLGRAIGNLEKEAAELIDYLNQEVVPEVRQHSTKALRIAAEKMTQLADYMEKHKPPQP